MNMPHSVAEVLAIQRRAKELLLEGKTVMNWNDADTSVLGLSARSWRLQTATLGPPPFKIRKLSSTPTALDHSFQGRVPAREDT